MAQYVTLSSLRERALQEADLQNSSFVATAEANRYINDAIAELVDHLIYGADHPWESKRVSIYVPKGYPAIWLPCDFYNLIQVSYLPGGIYGASATYDSASSGYSSSFTGTPRDRVTMVPFMEFEKDDGKSLTWSKENPPKYRLTCVQPRPEVVATSTLSGARGYTYISSISEVFPSATTEAGFTGSHWVNGCTLVALPSVVVGGTTYVDRRVPPPFSTLYYGFLLEFDRPPGEDSLLKLHYNPKAPELSADADVLIDYNGWAAYVVVAAAIKMRSKEESDTSELRARKVEAIERLSKAKRDVGYPQRVLDVTGTTRGAWRADRDFRNG